MAFKLTRIFSSLTDVFEIFSLTFGWQNGVKQNSFIINVDKFPAHNFYSVIHDFDWMVWLPNKI